MVLRDGSIVLIHRRKPSCLPGEKPQIVQVPDALARLRALHRARSVRRRTPAEIIEEMVSFRRSERENRAIDHDEEGSMEIKKREGYF